MLSTQVLKYLSTYWPPQPRTGTPHHTYFIDTYKVGPVGTKKEGAPVLGAGLVGSCPPYWAFLTHSTIARQLSSIFIIIIIIKLV